MEDMLLTFGDILWCDRSFNGYITKEVNHENGPFIVIEQQDDFVYAIKGIGFSRKKKLYRGDYIYIPKDVENKGFIKLRKKTVFKSNKIVKVDNKFILSYIGCLDSKEIDQLKRKMIINELYNPKCNNMLSEKITIRYKKGDIISFFGERYLIIDDSLNNYNEVIPYIISESQEDKFEYRFDLAMKIPKKSNDINFVGQLSEEKMKVILNRYLYFKTTINSNIEKNSHAGIGSIIIANDKIYYISSIDGDFYLCYQLVNENSIGPNLKVIDKQYTINFNQIKISKRNSSICVIKNLNNEEIERIRFLKKMDKINKPKSKKKSGKKKKSNSNPKLPAKLFGIRLKSTVFPFINCAVSNVEENVVEVVDLDELANGIFKTYCFAKDELVVVSKNYGEFVNYISGLDVAIDDERYTEFLNASGIYTIHESSNQPKRVRKQKSGF